MNENQAQELALRFLAAVTTADVDKTIGSEPAFAKAENWQPYGGQDKNWDRVSAQTSNAVGALAELIINSIDAILMRKSHEAGLGASNKDAPKSMTDAVKRFFPHVIEGKIASLSPQQRTALAKESVVIGVKRGKGLKKYPTYTIADFGEGQNAADFPKTLVSLGEKNKEGIPFVQGKFNMGSTGCIVFCTQSKILKKHYKFILSKRTLPDSDGKWGWTLIRTREVRAGEELPVVEYFCPDGQIPAFVADEVRALVHSNIGVVDGGTVVKLYEYDIGPGARAVDFGLHNALTTNLLHCALPIRIYDFNAERQPKRAGLRAEGIAERTFSGIHASIGQDATGDEDVDAEKDNENIDRARYQVAARTDDELGAIGIYATGIKTLKEYLLKHPHRVFYTLNGQAQSCERKSFFGRAKLDDLRNHLLVEVVCDTMDKTARSSIFKSDRERMSDTELTRKLKGIVVDELRDDRELREYAAEIRNRRASENIQKTEQDKSFWNDLIKQSPDLRELLGIGAVVPEKKPGGRGQQAFVGEKFPTRLELTKPADGVLHLPVNTYRRVECDTDAQNEYLGRALDTGQFVATFDKTPVQYSEKLRNGKLRITLHPPENAQEGDVTNATFGFLDSSRSQPLSVDVEIVFSPPEPKKSGGDGTTGGVKPKDTNSLKFPDIRPVKKDQWDEYDYDEFSGGHCEMSEDEVTIFVNRDNDVLVRLLKSEPREDQRKLAIHRFEFGVGILTFAMYKKFMDKHAAQDGGDTVDWDEHVRLASSAIAAHVVTLITRLGENPK